jgi:hypothetical protein
MSGQLGYNDYVFFQSSQSTSSFIATSFSLDASVWGDAISASTSIKDITQTSANSYTLISDRWLENSAYSVSSSCLRSTAFDPDLMADWTALRNNFTFDPTVEGQGIPAWVGSLNACMFSWGPYKSLYVPECELAYNFVQKWGTHVVTGLTTGSRALYTASAEATTSYSEKDFQASVRHEVQCEVPVSLGTA